MNEPNAPSAPRNACGTCTLCCKIMAVEELHKPVDTWCGHCGKNNGCTIYADRPKSCRDFECLWLHTQGTADPMPAAARPDRSRVVLDLAGRDDEGTAAMVVHVDPGYPNAWREGIVGRMIEGVSRNAPVFIRLGNTRRLLGPRGPISKLLQNLKQSGVTPHARKESEYREA